MAYCSHNLHFLADSHMMQGRLADARRRPTIWSSALDPHIADDADGRIDAHDEDSVLLRFGQLRRDAGAFDAAGGPTGVDSMVALRARRCVRSHGQTRRRGAANGRRSAKRPPRFPTRRFLAVPASSGQKHCLCSPQLSSTRESPRRAATAGVDRAVAKAVAAADSWRTTSRRSGSIRCASRSVARCFAPAMPRRPSVCSVTILPGTLATRGRSSA